MTNRQSTWAETRARLRGDAIRLRRFQASKFGYRPVAWFADPAWAAVVLHRLSALAWWRGHRKTGRLLMQINSLVTGVDIHPASDLGPGLLIPSPCGVTISCKAGRNLTVLALAGLGGSIAGQDVGAGAGLPVLGNDVMVGPFAGVQNGILVGDRAVIEGGAGALKEVPPDGRMALAAAPASGAVQPDSPAPRRPACPHRRWRVLRAEVGADVARYLTELSSHGPVGAGKLRRLGAFLTNPVLATTLHRVAHWQHANGRPRLARALARANLLVNRLTITPDSCIGGGMFVPHLAGTLFCGTAGAGLTLYANSLCAPLGAAGRGAAPVLGNNVTVSGHSAILGPVTVGSDVRLAAKVQAMRDLPDGADVFSPMARFHLADRQPTPSARSRTAVVPAAPSAPRLPWRVAHRVLRDRLARDRLAAAASGGRGLGGLACVRLHRLSHALFTSGHLRLARWAWLANTVWTGADISPASDLGPGLWLPHPAGLSIHATAGAGLTMLAQSGLGPIGLANGCLPGLSAAPVIGHDVTVGHHGCIFGPWSVGDRVHLASVSVTAGDVADDARLGLRTLKLRRAGTVADDKRTRQNPSPATERHVGVNAG